MLRPAVLLIAAPLGLSAQMIPALPPSSSPAFAPSLEELLPLRPWPLEEEGGARMPFTYRGERVLQEGNLWTLEQGALQSPELLLLADRIRFDRTKGTLLAEGHIRLEAKGLRLRCERLEMDWNARSGDAFALELEVLPSWNLQSDRVTFTNLRVWEFRAVEVSSCPQEKPSWKAKLSEMRLDLDGFATLKNARLYLGNVPFIPYYLPWAVYPAKAQRSSGLLPPLLGTSTRLGTTVGLSYFQTLGPTADLTLVPEYFSKEGLMSGVEVRWNPEPTHQGSFQGQSIHQRSTGERRYRYALKELWQREDGWQLSIDANRASDSLMDADFGRGLGLLGANAFDSALYVGKRFPWVNFSLQAEDHRSFFLPEDPLYRPDFPGSLVRRTLPQVQFRMFPIALGRFYLDADLRMSRLGYQIRVTDLLPESDFTWARSDLSLRLRGRIGQWGPLRADFEALGRVTLYGATLPLDAFDPSTGQSGSPLDPAQQSALDLFRVDGPGAKRFLGSARLQFSGPQIGRIFPNFRLWGYQGELKHLIEPFVGMTQTSRYGGAGRIARYDDVDIQPGVGGSAHGERSIELGLKQHFLGRSKGGEAYADLVRWRIVSRYHFSPILLGDGRVKDGWASVDSVIDVEPHDAFRLSFKRSADLVDGGVDDSLSAEYRQKDGSRYSLAAFSTGINRFLVRQQGIQIGALQRFLDDRIRLEAQANYDTRMKGFASSQVGLAYVTPCVATTLRFTHLALRLPGQTGKEDRLDLVLTLRGLGGLFTWRQ